MVEIFNKSTSTESEDDLYKKNSCCMTVVECLCLQVMLECITGMEAYDDRREGSVEDKYLVSATIYLSTDCINSKVLILRQLNI